MSKRGYALNYALKVVIATFLTILHIKLKNIACKLLIGTLIHRKFLGKAMNLTQH